MGELTARSSHASMVFGIVILSVCPISLYVRLSIIRVLCDETKEHIADILIADIMIPHESVINHSNLLISTEVGGRCPLPPEICT